MGMGVGGGVDVVVGVGVEVTVGLEVPVGTDVGDNGDDTSGPLGSLLQPTANVTTNITRVPEIGGQRLSFIFSVPLYDEWTTISSPAHSSTRDARYHRASHSKSTDRFSDWQPFDRSDQGRFPPWLHTSQETG